HREKPPKKVVKLIRLKQAQRVMEPISRKHGRTRKAWDGGSPHGRSGSRQARQVRNIGREVGLVLLDGAHGPVGVAKVHDAWMPAAKVKRDGGAGRAKAAGYEGDRTGTDPGQGIIPYRGRIAAERLPAHAGDAGTVAVGNRGEGNSGPIGQDTGERGGA